MKIHPVYTQLNQICDAKDTFFSLLKDYNPGFLFLSNNNSTNGVFSITGRNPYISVYIKDSVVNLKIGSEVFEIKSKNVGLHEVMKNILDVTLIIKEDSLNEQVPFRGGMICQKRENEISLFFPTEIMIFDHEKNNLTAIVNTYHTDKIEDDVFFRANVKIARMMTDLKTHCQKNENTTENQSGFSRIYQNYIDRIHSPYISIFKSKQNTTISSAPEAVLKTEPGFDLNKIFDLIISKENIVGYFNFDGSSNFIVPDMIIDKKDDSISFWAEKENDIGLLKHITEKD